MLESLDCALFFCFAKHCCYDEYLNVLYWVWTLCFVMGEQCERVCAQVASESLICIVLLIIAAQPSGFQFRSMLLNMFNLLLASLAICEVCRKAITITIAVELIFPWTQAGLHDCVQHFASWCNLTENYLNPWSSCSLCSWSLFQVLSLWIDIFVACFPVLCDSDWFKTSIYVLFVL